MYSVEGKVVGEAVVVVVVVVVVARTATAAEVLTPLVPTAVVLLKPKTMFECFHDEGDVIILTVTHISATYQNSVFKQILFLLK